MKKMPLIVVLSALLISCCIGGICLSKTNDTVYAAEVILLSEDTESTRSAMQNYISGGQIELYLGVADKKLPERVLEDKVYSNLLSYKIADETVVRVEDNYFLTPLKYGLTYISCQYANGKTYNYNIIVHNDTEFVKDVAIEGKNASQISTYKLNVGQKYPLDLKVSSSVNVAQVKVFIKSTHLVEREINDKTFTEFIDADQFLEITDEGKLWVKGVGVCTVKIQSATNRNDEGISFTVDSTIADDDLNSSVVEALRISDRPYITFDELNSIETLQFHKIRSFDQEGLRNVVGNLKKITCDISGVASSTSATLSLSDIELEIIGNASQRHAFSLSFEGNKANVLFRDVNVTATKSIVSSNTTDTTVAFGGKCELVAKNGNNAIQTNALTIRMLEDAEVAIYGGKGEDGTSTSTQGKNGGIGVQAEGMLNFIASATATTRISIYGGDGGNGSIPSGGGESGGNGGNGGVAVFAKNINCNGNIILDVAGGNGGHGADGKDGIQPTAKPTASRGRTPDATGDRGEDGDIGGSGGDGGRGGNGGEGLVATELISFQRGSITIVSGNGGNGGNGANGSTGGTGGKGGTGGGGYKFPWWFDGDGGQGGNGGQGGQGGRGGDGGDSANCIKAKMLKIRETELISATEGNSGFGGNGGNGGQGGQGGQGGNASTGNADSATNGSGGYGGQGGQGGSGGNSGHINGAISVTEINNIAVNIYVHLGKFATKQAFCGKPGAGGFGGKHGDYDYNGKDRSSEQATAGNNEGVFDGVIFTNRMKYPSEWSYIIFVQ